MLAALTAQPATPAALVGQVYPGLDPRLTGAAAQSLLAHLIELGAGGPRPGNQWGVVSPGLSPYRLSPTRRGA